MIDRKRYMELDHDSMGIYCHFDDLNIMNVKALVIGPKDTPYEGGFYFFNINFTNNYPMQPPHVDFCTLQDNVRFNPNLYNCGKVCLSILGTWNGPGWTSVMNLITILIDLQSLLNSNPIQNEPGYEKEVGERAKVYSSIVGYYNVSVAMLKMLKDTPKGFEAFKPIMERRFKQNISVFERFRDVYLPLQSTTAYSRYSGMTVKYLPESVLEEINNTLKNLDEPIVESKEITEEIAEEIKTTLKRKCPKEPAKYYEDGFTKAGLDNQLYVVKSYSSGMKRWVYKK